MYNSRPFEDNPQFHRWFTTLGMPRTRQRRLSCNIISLQWKIGIFSCFSNRRRSCEKKLYHRVWRRISSLVESFQFLKSRILYLFVEYFIFRFAFVGFVICERKLEKIIERKFKPPFLENCNVKNLQKDI